MQYFIGIDGGGSKTKLLCVDCSGNHVAESMVSGTYCREPGGVAVVIEALKKGINEILAQVDGKNACVFFGMPGYGENQKSDAAAIAEISAALAPLPVGFENDVICGWAGALALQPGIVIVGGTGSMAYGRDKHNHHAICGGWSEFFADEGSGYWLGKKTLELFARQSDGRLQKGVLYDLVREHFSLSDDFGIIEISDENFIHSRKNTAELQMILYEAARKGDISALNAYAGAADELASIVMGCNSRLYFDDETVTVSYVGGLFNVEDLILKPMQAIVRANMNAVFRRPLLSSCEGAILFAAEKFAKEIAPELRDRLLLRAEGQK